MKICEKDGTIVDIFAVYFIDNETMFYGFPKNYGGLMAFKEADVSVIDRSFTGRYVFFKEGVFHWALIEERLLDDLLEHDEAAYKKFLKILKEEKLLEENFF